MAYLSTLPFNGQLPQNFTFDDLAAYEEERRRSLLPQFQERMKTLRSGLQSQYDKNIENYRNLTGSRRSSLVASLADQSRKAFQMQNPYILEDLQSRGLASSPTTVAQAQAQALKELELQNQDELNRFDTESRGYQDALEKQRLQDLNELQALESQGAFDLEQDAVNQALDIRRSELERSIQEADAAREEALARNLAKEQRRAGLTESLLGAGTNLLGIGLMTRGGGGGGGGLGGLFGGGGQTASSSLVGGGQPFAVKGAGLFGQGGSLLNTAGTSAPGFGSLAGGLLGYQLGRTAFRPTQNGDRGAQNVGAAIGGVGGSLFGPAGSAIGSFLGSAVGKAQNRLQKGVEKSLGGTAGSIVKYAQPTTAIASVSKKIKKAFCFDGLTPVEMKDGTFKPICEIDIDDETRGGTVESIRISKVPDGSLFNYKGVLVTGYHAVKEGEQWVRVIDSLFGEAVPGDEMVFSIATSDHRVFVNNIEFADELENDNYEQLTIDQSLELLNSQSHVGVN